MLDSVLSPMLRNFRFQIPLMACLMTCSFAHGHVIPTDAPPTVTVPPAAPPPDPPPLPPHAPENFGPVISPPPSSPVESASPATPAAPSNNGSSPQTVTPLPEFERSGPQRSNGRANSDQTGLNLNGLSWETDSSERLRKTVELLDSGLFRLDPDFRRAGGKIPSTYARIQRFADVLENQNEVLYAVDIRARLDVDAKESRKALPNEKEIAWAERILRQAVERVVTKLPPQDRYRLQGTRWYVGAIVIVLIVAGATLYRRLTQERRHNPLRKVMS